MPKSKASVTMNYSVPVKVRRPALELAPSVAYLDLPKLAQAESAEVELGFIKAGCCRRQVRAIIRKGKVVDLQTEECPCAKPPTPEIKRLLKAAEKQLGGSGPQKWRPKPVTNFFREIGGTGIEVFYCIEICAFGYCLMCCLSTDKVNTGCVIFTDTVTLPTAE